MTLSNDYIPGRIPMKLDYTRPKCSLCHKIQNTIYIDPLSKITGCKFCLGYLPEQTKHFMPKTRKDMFNIAKAMLKYTPR